MPLPQIELLIVAVILALIIGYFFRKLIAERKIQNAEFQARKILDDAKTQAESVKREAIVEGKERALAEEKKIRESLDKKEKELLQKEIEVSKQEESYKAKTENLTSKLEDIKKQKKVLSHKEVLIQEKAQRLNELERQKMRLLENISGISSEEAKQMLIEDMKSAAQHHAELEARDYIDTVKRKAKREAKNIISLAIARYASDEVSNYTVSSVQLPSDDMKGRIIGREGRNIRALEAETGVNLIVDDTPEAVILSAFDPVRREIARLSLEQLIQDGRIHPGRIEEIVKKTRNEVEEHILEEGENVIYELGIQKISPKLVELLGRLKYRFSYGQNVLLHSKEVAYFAGMMAAELELDETLARRAGLLHDIGKAVDHNREGTHQSIGAEIAKKAGERKEVLSAILTHHDDIQQDDVYSVLVSAADSLSAARPSARRDTISSYIKRLEKLENIANSFLGVSRTFAIQAGREIRIMVEPDKIDDTKANQLCKDIVTKIEKELTYPGQIKVTVIRETRSIDYAK